MYTTLLSCLSSPGTGMAWSGAGRVLEPRSCPGRAGGRGHQEGGTEDPPGCLGEVRATARPDVCFTTVIFLQFLAKKESFSKTL